MLTPAFLAASMIALGLASSLLGEDMTRRLAHFDRDGDGKLDRTELRALLAALREAARRPKR
jgi:Ca2+-binding EF-hand superfamily protein